MYNTDKPQQMDSRVVPYYLSIKSKFCQDV
nr:MAG TPA: hypothetical protein [Caudoviricetes sp.]